MTELKMAKFPNKYVCFHYLRVFINWKIWIRAKTSGEAPLRAEASVPWAALPNVILDRRKLSSKCTNIKWLFQTVSEKEFWISAVIFGSFWLFWITYLTQPPKFQQIIIGPKSRIIGPFIKCQIIILSLTLKVKFVACCYPACALLLLTVANFPLLK